jgi:hypothetical protein
LQEGTTTASLGRGAHVPGEVPDVTGEVPYNPQDVGQVPQEVNNVQQEADDDVTSGHHVPKFFFKFANAKRTSKAIKDLNNTEALGRDGILTSVLKKGVEVLAGPVSHLVNRSMAEGGVPAAFKIGKVHPIHKGKGKPRDDPASYSPVSILPAMSKVLESLVKGDLEDHLKKVTGLPGSQYGFRPKRSCTSALAHAQAGWLSGAAKGQVFGLMAFDLSAGLDTVAAKQLAPTLHALGVTGRELKWFLCYMSGGKQCVVWDGTVSGLTDVLYGGPPRLDTRADFIHRPHEQHGCLSRRRGRVERGLPGQIQQVAVGEKRGGGG